VRTHKLTSRRGGGKGGPGGRAGGGQAGYSGIMLVRLALAMLPACALVTACSEPPVRWRESAVAPPAPIPEMRLAVDGVGRVTWLPPEAAPASVPPASAACPGSLRIARAGEQNLYAVWWQPRADSSAALLAARSVDGGRTWPEVAPVDTADRGVNGCRRPAPSVVADPATGYVHVAYALAAPGAPGVFFSHSMPGQFMFHAPVAIVYGERPGRASIAASDSIVAVAYEDPNSADPRVALALSRTLGHTFEHRVAASTGVGSATEPRVALAGATVAVAWRQGRSARGVLGPAPSDGPMIVRLGELSRS
jgi:hypothetical protein